MAMTIFFVLNGLGVVFLLYVLVKFWKEGHGPKNNAQKYAAEFGRRDWADMTFATHPISHATHGGPSVIPFPSRRQEFRDKPSGETISRGTIGGTVRRISTR